MVKRKFAWKTLVAGMKSSSGSVKWKVGEWKEAKGTLSLCNNGFHASNLIPDAMRYVSPAYVCKVEYGGDVIEDSDKFVVKRMRMVKAYEWTKKDSCMFSVFCVKQSMKYVDRQKFPRVFEVCQNSISAVEAWIKNPCETTVKAAWSAGSAALSARSAADSAIWSADSAAWSAELAARSAARSAELAAGSAARSAESAAKKLQHNWLIKHLKNKQSESDSG